MPRGPRGERRPADAAQAALEFFRIAVGEQTEGLPSGRRQSRIAGATARVQRLTPQRRKNIAKKAATSRWRNQRKGAADGAT